MNKTFYSLFKRVLDKLREGYYDIRSDLSIEEWKQRDFQRKADKFRKPGEVERRLQEIGV